MRIPAPTLDMVAEVKIQLMADGSLSVQGQLQDPVFALKLLDHAADAIRSQIANRPQIMIPNRDVDLDLPPWSQKALGDIPPGQRGDAG